MTLPVPWGRRAPQPRTPACIPCEEVSAERLWERAWLEQAEPSALAGLTAPRRRQRSQHICWSALEAS
jgi:hypothetical protein